MQFLYEPQAGQELISLSGESYKYIFRVRRFRVGDIVELRNMQDSKLYSYKVLSVDKKDATLSLIYDEERVVTPKKDLTIGWCIVDPKTVEKALPTLNEMGISKIVFIKCTYSQANFKINIDRLKKIALSSSGQCGRSSLIEFDFSQSLENFLLDYKDAYLLNFSSNNIESKVESIDTIVIGCEGGLSKEEVSMFDNQKVVGFNTPLILKSESAVVGAVSKILL